jgi:hypothetical protein
MNSYYYPIIYANDNINQMDTAILNAALIINRQCIIFQINIIIFYQNVHQ